MAEDFQLGITTSFPCNYLLDEKERLLVAVDPRLQNKERYAWLMEQGFRRSGDQIYRPHCELCNACKSIRVVVDDFNLSKSQKRLLKRNSEYNVRLSHEIKDDYYPLYEDYINTIHHDGSMFPASYKQYKGFLSCTITEQIFIEILDGNNLIAVAITDVLPMALSAVYTFYQPSYRSSSIGVFSILNQIDIASTMNKKFLYLGYQIDRCQKMNYKNKYFPYQELINNGWKTVKK